MPLVEVVAPPEADPGVVESATRLVTGWGKVAVRSADAPGFIVNRVNRPFTLEALQMLEAGDGSVESIDRAIRADGFPMGPFELMDLIGIDVNLAAARGIYEAFHYEPRFRPSVIQERLVEAGRFGRKTGEGFYWYGEDGRPLGAAGAFAAEPEPPAAAIPAAPRLPAGTGASPRDRGARRRRPRARGDRGADRAGDRERGVARARRRRGRAARHRPRGAARGRASDRSLRADGGARWAGRGRRADRPLACGRTAVRPCPAR